MTQYEKQGIFAKDILTEHEMTDIEELAVMCGIFDELQLNAIIIDMLIQQRSGNETRDFLYYEQGQLVGYLGIDDYGTQEKNFMVMVSPEHRRKGIARFLLQAAKEESRHSGIEQLVLMCERASTSGAAFAQAIQAHLAYSEHEMELETLRERPVFDERLTFRQAVSSDDLAAVVSVMASDIGNVEQAQQYVTDTAKRDNQRFYLMTFGGPEVGCDEPIGSLRLVDLSVETAIYGFVVRPEYRGKGYGRQLLQEAIRFVRLRSSEPIMLEVDVTNTNALGLYLTLGFKIKTTYDYYNIDM